jgi:hypothetical protein
MSKNIVVKMAILLVVLALVYSVFWFFKVGQIEKQVKNFISKNSSHISAGEISVSGFPLSQKITIRDLKFTIPNPLLNKHQVIAKHLEARAGIFSSSFSITMPEPATVQDADGNSATVKFNKEPEIMVSIVDSRAVKFSYHDSGYRILDADENVLYAAASSAVNLESTISDDDKIVTKITADVKDIEGFDMLDVYKNGFEKKVVEGIKTGEVVLGNSSVALIPAQVDGVANTTPVKSDATIQAATPTATTDENVAVATKSEEMASAPDGNVAKNNFVVDVEYILSPNQTGQQAQIPTDPTQIQEVPMQFSNVLKVNSLEFSTPLYKVLVNGEMSTLADDNMPSGSMAVRIEKIDNFISQVSAGFSQMIEQKKPAVAEIQSSDLSENAASSQDSYQDFLKRVVAGFGPITKELAAKNAVSKEDVAEFDVRREKNLEFLINETSVREILGKF